MSFRSYQKELKRININQPLTRVVGISICSPWFRRFGGCGEEEKEEWVKIAKDWVGFCKNKSWFFGTMDVHTRTNVLYALAGSFWETRQRELRESRRASDSCEAWGVECGE